jgi:mRNA interferase MazF
MGAFTSLQIVLLPFPFSDLSASKLRPALILADADKGDWILWQITSNPYADATAIELLQTDFTEGSLQRISYVRPSKLFTANQGLFRKIAGVLHHDKQAEVIDAIVKLLRSGLKNADWKSQVKNPDLTASGERLSMKMTKIGWWLEFLNQVKALWFLNLDMGHA